jgi:hypothetical protein
MKPFAIAAFAALITPSVISGQQVVTGQAAFADYSE